MNAVEIYEKAAWDVDHSKITFGEFEERIKPLYDVEPVRHGAWKEVLAGMDYQYECTICKACVEQEYPYCPNCGARMDGEEE